MSHHHGIMGTPERKDLRQFLQRMGGVEREVGKQHEVGTTGAFPISYFLIQSVRIAIHHGFQNIGPSAAKIQEHVLSF